MTAETYDLADALYRLAPWNWMSEIDLIAIEHPDTGRRDHISVMGMDGAHLALAVYTGPESRRRFNLTQAREINGVPPTNEDLLDLLLATPHLQCAFGTRAELFESERAAIKASGRKYRGKNWPCFRRFQPGHCPSRADDEEIGWLRTAIEQVLEITPDLSPDGVTLRTDAGTETILTRSLRDGRWQTSWTEDDNSLHAVPRPEPDEALVANIRNHRRAVPLAVQFQLLNAPVGDSREDSLFPYLLLVIDADSQLILGCDIFSVEDQSYHDLIASVPNTLLRICDDGGFRPSSFEVTSPVTRSLLHATAEAFQIPCRRKTFIPAIDQAMESMMGFLG